MKRSAVAAAALALGLALGGCSFATLQNQNASQGVNTLVGGVHVQNLLLVNDGSKAQVIGTVLSPADDTLTTVSVAPVDSTAKPASSA